MRRAGQRRDGEHKADQLKQARTSPLSSFTPNERDLLAVLSEREGWEQVVLRRYKGHHGYATVMLAEDENGEPVYQAIVVRPRSRKQNIRETFTGIRTAFEWAERVANGVEVSAR